MVMALGKLINIESRLGQWSSCVGPAARRSGRRRRNRLCGLREDTATLGCEFKAMEAYLSIMQTRMGAARILLAMRSLGALKKTIDAVIK